MIQQEPFKPSWVSVALLSKPRYDGGRLRRGVIILNQVDHVVGLFPSLPRLFIIVERRGWNGINRSYIADVKLIEDLSTLDETRLHFPKAVLLPYGPADFVDTDVFRPLNDVPEYDGIQIACWSRRKRIELLIMAASLLPGRQFVHLGHFENNGSIEELTYRESCVSLAARIAPNLHFRYANARGNSELPTDKNVINAWINRAKIGILTTQSEGINRFKMECMSANRPMLLPDDVGSTTSKHLTAKTGIMYRPTPADLALAIEQALHHGESFTPREHLASTTGKRLALNALKVAVHTISIRDGFPYMYDDIDWDGRNESLFWGDEGVQLLRDLVAQFPAPIVTSTVSA